MKKSLIGIVTILMLFITIISGVVTEDAGVTIINPYESIDWNIINQYNFAHHVHARGETYEDAYQLEIDRYLGGDDKYHALQLDDREANKTPVWPWQDFGRHPVELNIYNVPGSESFGTDHQNHFVWLWSFHQHDHKDHHVAFQSSEDDALVYLAHPVEGKSRSLEHYGEPLPFEWVEEFFDKYEKLRGLAVLNDYREAYNEEDFDLWHELLIHFGPERPVYGYSEADCSAGSKGCFDHRYDRVLATEIPHVHPDDDYSSPNHESEFKDAWGEGRTFWINNKGPGIPPYITNIMVDGGTITLELEGSYDYIKWMYGTEKIGSGDSFDITETNINPSYIRFEVWQGDIEDASNANIVGSQAFYVK